ncbi:MAG TPA: hypothetical protein VMU19_14770, partial [Bryobacteraceae bacterium]|nr:hypothetical protein [Bryobacteraceae bacterium]
MRDVWEIPTLAVLESAPCVYGSGLASRVTEWDWYHEFREDLELDRSFRGRLGALQSLAARFAGRLILVATMVGDIFGLVL